MKNVLQKYKTYLTAEHKSPNTRRDYYCHIKQFLKITNETLNQDSIIEYRAYLNQNYNNRNTRNKKIIAVNQFLKWSGHRHLCMKNIGWEIPSLPTLKDEEISRLLETAYSDPELYLMTLLLWEGLLRDEEIINLKTNDRIDNRLYLKKTKTGNKTVILSPRLIEAWDKYLKNRPTPKKEYRQYLFINSYKDHYGKKFKRINPLIRRIKKLGLKCNIKFEITPYTIRRSSGTLRQDKFSDYYAGDVKIVQRMFNHRNIETTLRYDHRTDSDVEKYLESVYNTEQSKYKPNQPAYKEGLNNFCSAEHYKQQEENNNTFSFSHSFLTIEKTDNNIYQENYEIILDTEIPILNNQTIFFKSWKKTTYRQRQTKNNNMEKKNREKKQRKKQTNNPPPQQTFLKKPTFSTNKYFSTNKNKTIFFSKQRQTTTYEPVGVQQVFLLLISSVKNRVPTFLIKILFFFSFDKIVVGVAG